VQFPSRIVTPEEAIGGCKKALGLTLEKLAERIVTPEEVTRKCKLNGAHEHAESTPEEATE
jgi:hypothetical protein